MSRARKIKAQFIIFIISLFPILAFSATNNLLNYNAKNNLPITYPTNQTLYDRYPLSLMYYYGVTEDNTLLRVLSLHDLDRWPEHISSIELARTLDEDNFLRRFLNPLVGVVQVAGNVTVRNGKNQNQIFEFDPYLMFRWANLPWNNYVTTSFALAEGVSYVSSVPAVEKKNNDNTKRLLNYLIVEGTFALPNYPRLQLVARIHHRSGAYGLYHAGNSGSNDIGLGIRYLFD